MRARWLTLMPLLTFLTIFPLWVLARLLAGSHEADLAAMLYVVTPSVLIVTNHLQFPLRMTSARLPIYSSGIVIGALLATC